MSEKQFEEVENLEKLEKELDQMHKSWAEICEVSGVDKDQPMDPQVLTKSLKTTLMDLDEIQNLDYVKKSGKKLENLSENYLKALIKSVYIHVEQDDSHVWAEEVERYLKQIFTSELLSGYQVKPEDDRSYDSKVLLEDIQRIFSIANQLNMIRGMERGSLDSAQMMNLEDNFIYLHIAIVQVCNKNAVIMGKAVSFIKALIKINDNILKSISQMLAR